ncbi:MAG: hypothetical protein P4L22_03195 [Candidatus Babeliales bacterium]|nr:hypothetical protein [Candidatus Babeliales bacterium]
MFIFLFLFTPYILSDDLADIKTELPKEESVKTLEPKTDIPAAELTNTELKVIQEEVVPNNTTELPIVDTHIQEESPLIEKSEIVPDASAKPVEPDFEPGKLELLDKIEAEVTTSTQDSTDVQIITMSDIKKRGFDGGKYTLDDLINEALADNLGKTFKINLTDDDVNKYLKRANLTDKKQLKKLTETWGYESLEDFYESFKKIYRANTALNYEMSSQLVVLEKEIQDYYEQHPVYKEAVYTIETTFVLLDSTKTKEELKKELEEFAAGTKNLDYIIWDLPITIKKAEVTDSSKFLEDMAIGSIYIKELNDGFDLFKLIDKQPDITVPLEERKKVIVEKLQTQKHEQAAQKVNDNLHSKAIVYKPDQKVPEHISELGL